MSGSGPIEAGEAVISGLTAAGSVNDAKTGAEMVSVLAQAAATMASLATNPIFAGITIATNVGAAATQHLHNQF